MSEHLPIYQVRDVILLCAIFDRGKHYPPVSASEAEWRAYYEDKLEDTMAEWLADAFVSWQFENQRNAAFGPVSHLVGTMREDASYISSFAHLCLALEAEDDRSYREPLNAYFAPPQQPGEPEPRGVSLGTCLINSVPKAVRLLVDRMQRSTEARGQSYCAIRDLLLLSDEVTPQKGDDTLCESWASLFGKAVTLEPAQVPVLQYYLLLAFQRAAHPGMMGSTLGHLVAKLVRNEVETFDAKNRQLLLRIHTDMFTRQATFSTDTDFDDTVRAAVPASYISEKYPSIFSSGEWRGH
jgi:hypothetical protein